MERWEIKPNESVGEIRFGMSRDEVHNLFETKCTEFKKSKFGQNTTDDYGRFHVFYTQDNMVDAVEFFEGIELTLNGRIIFPIKANDIEKVIPGIDKDGDSYTHVNQSIGIETDSDKAESILVGSRGYYG